MRFGYEIRALSFSSIKSSIAWVSFSLETSRRVLMGIFFQKVNLLKPA